MTFLRSLTCFSLLAAAVCLTGCGEKNLGSPDNPEKFTQEVINEFDAQIAEVEADDSLSDKEKAKRIEQIEAERDQARRAVEEFCD